MARNEGLSGRLRSLVGKRSADGADEALKEARRKIVEKNERLKKLRDQVERKDQELETLRAKLARSKADIEVGGVRPRNIVWIFGAGRTGSTWLTDMMEDLGHLVWREPLVGELFGSYYSRAGARQRQSPNFILGCHSGVWLASIRFFVLNGVTARFPEADNEELLVVKEPNGSVGAPLLVKALPESRMIFLIRDPRDVVASVLDAFQEGSWNYKRRGESGWDDSLARDKQVDAFIETRAEKYLQDVGSAKRAYDSHEGSKTLVRYEELRTDTLETMRRIYAELGIPVEDEDIDRIVKKHAWESVPKDKKGEGRFYRKATPGGWHEDLTPAQSRTIETVTAPLLKEFYSTRIETSSNNQPQG